MFYENYFLTTKNIQSTQNGNFYRCFEEQYLINGIIQTLQRKDHNQKYHQHLKQTKQQIFINEKPLSGKRHEIGRFHTIRSRSQNRLISSIADIRARLDDFEFTVSYNRETITTLSDSKHNHILKCEVRNQTISS